jgi:large subunit ribosomal protein L29
MAKAKKTEAKATKKSADIRPMTDDQIGARVAEIAKEKMNLRFQKAAGQQANPKAATLLRKENARLKTEQSARRNTKSA